MYMEWVSFMYVVYCQLFSRAVAVVCTSTSDGCQWSQFQKIRRSLMLGCMSAFRRRRNCWNGSTQTTRQKPEHLAAMVRGISCHLLRLCLHFYSGSASTHLFGQVYKDLWLTLHLALSARSSAFAGPFSSIKCLHDLSFVFFHCPVCQFFCWYTIRTLFAASSHPQWRALLCVSMIQDPKTFLFIYYLHL